MYEQRSKEPLGERVKASVLTSITCGHRPLKEHIGLNSGRLRTYTQIREDITLYLEGKADAAAQLRHEPAPMDVGGVGRKGDSLQPRGGGKGPAEGCYNCGGPHYAIYCPTAGADDAGGKPSRPTPRKGGKTKGREKGKKGNKGKKGRETNGLEEAADDYDYEAGEG